MHGTGDELFARAWFTEDADGHIALRDTGDEGEHFPNGERVPDDAVDRRITMSAADSLRRN